MASYGAREAINTPKETITYEELLRRVHYWRTVLRQGVVAPGSVVALKAQFTPSGIAALLALAAERTLVVPLGPMPVAQFDEFCEISQVEFVLDPEVSPQPKATGRNAGAELYEKLRALPAAGLVLFSSGSTGRSKASVLNFDDLMGAHLSSAKRPKGTVTFLNFDHIGGINTLFHTLSHGGTVISCPDRTPAAVLQRIEETQAQVLPTTPTFLTMCLIEGRFEQHDLSSLEVITYGTEPMPEQTLARVAASLPHVRMKQTYGLSELGIMSTRSKSNDSLWVKVGGPGFEYKVVDGILWVKSSRAMLGYLNAPYHFDEDGFFNTQDQVEVDGEYLKILGRSSEIINVGGLKVYPNEVESAILQVPGVADVLVSGRPNPVTGQVVQARVRPEDSMETHGLVDRILAHCSQTLDDYKAPVHIEVTKNVLHSERFKKARA